MKKRPLFYLSTAVLAVSIFAGVGNAEQAEAPAAASFTDTSGHWAEASILAAVQKGYVSGYPEGTFQPEKTVSRSEFIAMLVRSLGQASDTSTTSPWYTPYVKAATESGYYVTGDFSSDDWNAPLSRQELARIAVRVIGKTAKDNTEYMYMATSNGVLSGTGNGALNVTGTTTRAQTVTVIERISSILQGETLPVDALAVANAQEAMKAPKDPWGRAIRTTNLPKNAKDFPYILEEYPNEMYELELPFKGITEPAFKISTPAELYKTDTLIQDKKEMEKWKENAEAYYKLLLNVDYRTIDGKWATDLYSHKNQWSRLEEVMAYVAWVKKNKIVTEGSLVVEPSMVFHSRIGGYFMRSQFSFRIKEYNEYKDIFDDDRFNTHQKFDNLKSLGKFQKGQWYYGYTNTELSTNVQDGVQRVSSDISLFKLSTIIHKKN
ncbi:hypothetical protein GC101_18050 [Paenibacillus sp. LMG 31459]|uniref:SLH domain-containing protein n=1 Tax=Paenibacillus phytohabitans TaxID=2654978 RepID=A0ABX1YLN8_9BACL|nr:S-layer homology domain-containing protein [Paenibacillus phytohabitans]NOU80768.1 hypothetical protein [Paenibacillus phytohabitans]